VHKDLSKHSIDLLLLVFALPSLLENAAPHTCALGFTTGLEVLCSGGCLTVKMTQVQTMAEMGRLLCAGRAHCGGVSVGGGGRSRRERGAVGAPGGATGRAHSADGADGSPAPADAGEATAAQKSKNFYHAFRGTNVCTFVPPHFFSSLFRLTEFILPPPHPSVKEESTEPKQVYGVC